MKYALIILLLSLSFFSVKAADSTLVKMMTEAREFMADGSYHSANIVFIEMIRTEKVLPDDMAYWFGLSLYHTDHKKQSAQFLQKYIELKSDSTEYYPQAKTLLEIMEKG